MSPSRYPFLRLLQPLLDLVGPERCVECGAACDGFVCTDCLHARPLEEPEEVRLGGVPVLAAARYAPPVSVAVRRLKYERRPDLARPLSALVARRLGGHLLRPDDLLVPVPLHPKRLAERGYNQSALLAKRIGLHTGARCALLVLARVRNTPQLAGRPRESRAASVRRAIIVRRPEQVSGRAVVLVDDVVTTGATATACIEALQRAGASVSAVVAVARAVSPDEDV